jgi:hypothetical protein
MDSFEVQVELAETIVIKHLPGPEGCYGPEAQGSEVETFHTDIAGNIEIPACKSSQQYIFTPKGKNDITDFLVGMNARIAEAREAGPRVHEIEVKGLPPAGLVPGCVNKIILWPEM